MSNAFELEVAPRLSGEFEHSIALVIGIGAYTNDIAPLRSAAADARRLASILETKHHYEVTLLTDQQATAAGFRQALAGLATRVGPNDRLLVYYAGHGQTNPTLDDDRALSLIPQDADRTRTESWLPYTELIGALDQLSCRHFLLILDCCFAGSVRGANMGKSHQRDLAVMPKKLYLQRYLRFIEDRAWQVLTSSAGDQTANDLPFDQRAGGDEHSPFAQALFSALEGQSAGLMRDDGVITATDLYSYLRDQVEAPSMAHQHRQTPQLWPLQKHDKGEFVFLVPGRNPYDLPKNPTFTPDNNPYLGLCAFEEQHQSLLFGRETAAAELAARVESAALTIVSGPSGSGKTSLVQAGLLPKLRASTARQILAPMALGANPAEQLASLALPAANPGTLEERIAAWAGANPGTQLVLVLDQLEALAACPDERAEVLNELAGALAVHAAFLKLIVIVRADAESMFASGPLQPYWQNERVFDLARWDMASNASLLRAAIVGPAGERALFFESDELVSRIISTVIKRPGALALLSLTLSQMYLRYIKRAPDDRTITADDYDDLSSSLNGTEKALIGHANELYEQLRPSLTDAAERTRAQQLLLRMVNIEGGTPSPRQVYFSNQPGSYKELDYAASLHPHMRALLERLVAARLVVAGSDAIGPYAVPAHEALVQKWDHLVGWLQTARDDVELQRRLFPSAEQWKNQSRAAQGRRQRRRATGQLWLENSPDFDRTRVTLNTRDSWMNNLEREFVGASIAEQNRRARWRRFSLIATIATLSLLLLAAVGLIVYSNQLEDDAVVQRLMIASKDPPPGTGADAPLLLAAEAVVRAGSANISGTLQLQADQNLRNILAQPDVVAPITTFDYVDSASFLPDGRVLLFGLRRAQLWAPSTGTFTTLAEDVDDASLSPDGRQILTLENDNTAWLRDLQGKQLVHFAGDEISTAIVLPGSQNVLSANFGTLLQLWSPDGRPLGPAVALEPADDAYAPAIDRLIGGPNGRQAVILMSDGPAWLWSTDAAPVQLAGTSTNPDHTAKNAAFSPDGGWLALGYDDGGVELWDMSLPPAQLATAKPTLLQGQFGWINSVEWSPDGETLLTASTDRTVRLWALDGTPQASLNDHNDVVLSAHFSSDGSMIITASGDGNARVWNRDGYLMLVFRHTAPVDEAFFSPDGKNVLTVLTNQLAELWPSEQPIPGLVRGPGSPIEHVALAPSRAELLTTSADDATIWTLQGQELATFGFPDTTLIAAELSPDGQSLLARTDLGAELRDRKDSQIAAHTLGGEEVSDAHFSPDGQRIVTAEGEQAHLWDRNGVLLQSFAGHTDRVNTAMFSPDGQHVLTASDDHTALLWDLQGQLITTLSGHEGEVTSALFSPDGQQIATLGTDNTVRLWDLKGQEVHKFDGAGLPEQVVFSPDGRWLAIRSDFKSALMWDLTAPTMPVVMNGHVLPVTALRFSPDGKNVLTTSDDRTARLWDLDGHELITLRGSADMVTDADFIPAGTTDAQTIITSSGDSALRFYPLDRDALLAQAACRVNGVIGAQTLGPLVGSVTDTGAQFDYRNYTCPIAAPR